MVKTLQATDYNIEIGSIAESSFSELLRTKYAASKKIILVDENTHDHCLEYLITSFQELEEAEIMLLPCGEENKVMEVCFQVWEAWSEYEIGRSDLVINLGGGVVTDMGGFIASIFKRGLDFIHIPTSLLAMVDASIGGKTGIDLGMNKNLLGVFSNPVRVFIDPGFLGSLPLAELKNGFAEMLKHGLIRDKAHWDIVKFISPEEDIFGAKIIAESVEIKNKIVLADPLEKGERKKLNFGHTIGHAIEGFFLGEEQMIAHGHAVAIGMLGEAFISKERGLLSETDFNEIESVITRLYEMPEFLEDITDELFALMMNDKKNFDQKVQCTLLLGIGKCVINQAIFKDDLKAALNYFSSQKSRV